jgi:hypothetical protein
MPVDGDGNAEPRAAVPLKFITVCSMPYPFKSEAVSTSPDEKAL